MVGCFVWCAFSVFEDSELEGEGEMEGKAELNLYAEDLRKINESLLTGIDEQQRRIAEAGIGLTALLLAKNADYGSSAWRTPILVPNGSPADAIYIRMSDKIERIRSLRSAGSQRQVADETLIDTVRDLCGYCLLLLAMPDGETAEEPPTTPQAPQKAAGGSGEGGR